MPFVFQSNVHTLRLVYHQLYVELSLELWLQLCTMFFHQQQLLQLNLLQVLLFCYHELSLVGKVEQRLSAFQIISSYLFHYPQHQYLLSLFL